jgi:transcriptional regulator with XRE-family HTH domain
MGRETEVIKTVGQNIRDLRVRSGWSLRLAAKKLNISTSALSKIETGVTDVNLSRLEQIAQVYGVKLIQLWLPNFEYTELEAIKLDQAKEKVNSLETEIKAFQRKVILLYEKLHEQNSRYNHAS